MHHAIAEDRFRVAMIHPRRVLHLLILLAAMHIPAGTSTARDATAQNAFGGESICAGETDSTCWHEIGNIPGCYLWNPQFNEKETVTWSGSCVDGKASGTGHVTWRYKVYGQSKTGTGEGPYVDGRKHGHWVWRYANGIVDEGPYVDGRKHGHWVERPADGTVAEGPYMDGKEHGHWVARSADGTVAEGPVVDGLRQGHWVWRFADGTVDEGPYVDGRMHGHWVKRFANGDVHEGPYVDGERHGNWVYYLADGNVTEAQYVDGERR